MKDAQYILSHCRIMLRNWSSDLQLLLWDVERHSKETHDTQTLLMLRNLEHLIVFLRGWVDIWSVWTSKKVGGECASLNNKGD